MADEWRDMRNIAEDMNDAANHADGEGLFMDEYDDYSFPNEYRFRTQIAMDRWENGVADLHQAAEEIKAIAYDMMKEDGDEDQRVRAESRGYRTDRTPARKVQTVYLPGDQPNRERPHCDQPGRADQ